MGGPRGHDEHEGPMTKSDPFGFDMSVSGSKKKNPRGRRGMSGASETSTRPCDHAGCPEAG